VRTLPELVAYVKAHPGTFYAHSSGSKQLSGEAFRLKAGLDMPPVAYKGAAPMMTDLLSGQVKIGFDEVLTSMQQIKAGRIIPIATTGSVRWPALPDVPTIAELGGPLADYEVTGWFGLLAPAGTPPAIVNRLSETLQKAFADKDFRERIYNQGSEPTSASRSATISSASCTRPGSMPTGF
jgi:tripartite-type tricarboxylate transporter receptor subunit TctC